MAVYEYGAGFGSVVLDLEIEDGANTIRFTDDFTAQDASIGSFGYYYDDASGEYFYDVLVIAGPDGDKLIIDYEYDYDSPTYGGSSGSNFIDIIENIEFSDGVVLEMSDGLNATLNYSNFDDLEYEYYSFLGSYKDDNIVVDNDSGEFFNYYYLGSGNDSLQIDVSGFSGYGGADGGEGDDTIDLQSDAASADDLYVDMSDFQGDDAYILANIQSHIYDTDGVNTIDLYEGTNTEVHILPGSDVVNNITIHNYTLSDSFIYYGYGFLNIVNMNDLDNVLSICTYSQDDVLLINNVTFSDGSMLDFSDGVVTNDLNTSNTLYGSSLDDTFYDNGGNDTVYAGDGNDKMFAGTGADYYDGEAGIRDSVLYTESTAGVNVSLVTGMGAGGYAEGDTLVNIERLYGSDYADALYGDANDNLLQGYAGNDMLDGGAGNDRIYGRSGSNTIFDGAGDDAVYGGTGNDKIRAGAGADDYDGGEGTGDYVSYYDSDAAVQVSLLTGVGTGGYAEGDTLENIERLYGSLHDDHLTGDNGANILKGYAGDDTLDGQGGDDIIYGTSGSSYILDGDGDDTVIGGTGNDKIRAGAGADDYDGGDGSGDYVSYYDSDAAVQVSLLTGVGTGGYAEGDTLENIERLYGSQHNDLLIGDDDANILKGYTGDDTIHDLGGDDTVYGGEGNDLMFAGAGADHYDGEAGTRDSVLYTESTAGVNVSLATGVGTGGYAEGDTLSNVERLYGSDYDDVIYGDDNANLLQGYAGNDMLDGGAGNDRIYGRSGSNTIFDGAGDDFIYGGTGNDKIRAGAGADSIDGGDGIGDYVSYYDSDAAVQVSLLTGVGTGGYAEGDTLAGVERLYGSQHDDNVYGDTGKNILKGYTGDDVLRGYNDNDIFYGGEGADILSGGSGADVFIFSTVDDTTVGDTDVITDFNSGQDMLDFTAIGLTDFSKFNFSYDASADMTSVSYDNVNDFALDFSGDTQFDVLDLV